MKIDNGDRRPLVIANVFDGICGISRGQLAFVPSTPVSKLPATLGAVLDGEPVRLFDVSPSTDGRAYTARVEWFG